MCIGIPMQVVGVANGFAQVCGRDETRRVRTTLIGPCEVGQWLLIFIDDARERISAERAAEVNATLDLLALAMAPGRSDAFQPEASFALPSAMDANTLLALTGGHST
jgi:hydrogenase expression/formation protein HypC